MCPYLWANIQTPQEKVKCDGEEQDFRIGPLGLKAEIHAVWPLGSLSTSLCLCSLICKMVIVLVSTHRFPWDNEVNLHEIMHGKHSAKGLAHCNAPQMATDTVIAILILQDPLCPLPLCPYPPQPTPAPFHLCAVVVSSGHAMPFHVRALIHVPSAWNALLARKTWECGGKVSNSYGSFTHDYPNLEATETPLRRCVGNWRI